MNRFALSIALVTSFVVMAPMALAKPATSLPSSHAQKAHTAASARIESDDSLASTLEKVKNNDITSLRNLYNSYYICDEDCHMEYPTKEYIIELLTALKSNTSVTELTIDNGFDDHYAIGSTTQSNKYDPDILAALVDLLKTTQTINVLATSNSLSDQHVSVFGPADLAKINQAIRENSHVIALNLWNWHPTSPELNNAVLAFMDNPQINRFDFEPICYKWDDISSNPVHESMIFDAVLSAIDKLGTNKTLVEFSYNVSVGFDDPTYMDPLTAHLRDALKTNTTLKNLYIIPQAQLNSEASLNMFADALKTNTSLTDLHFWYGGADWTDARMKILVDALAAHPMLKTLVFDQFIELAEKNTGVILLDYVANSALTTFTIGYPFTRRFNNTEVQHLASLIDTNTSLKNLTLYNMISYIPYDNDEPVYNAGALLGDALRHNKTLVTLDLSKDIFETQDIATLASSLEENTTLTDFTAGSYDYNKNRYWNNLSDADYVLLQARLERNQGLE